MNKRRMLLQSFQEFSSWRSEYQTCFITNVKFLCFGWITLLYEFDELFYGLTADAV